MNLVHLSIPTTLQSPDSDSDYESAYTSPSESELIDKEAKLRSSINHLNNKIEVASKAITETEKLLDELCADEISVLEELTDNIREVEEELFALDSEDFFEEEREKELEEQRSNPELSPEPEFVEKSSKVKKLFNRIARLTHPDKTDDPILNELFVEARRRLNYNDYEGLLEIMECVTKNVSLLFRKLTIRIAKLEHELSTAFVQWSMIERSDMYKLTKACMKGDPFLIKSAQAHYLKMIDEQTNKAATRLSKLKVQLLKAKREAKC